ncbi:hypothetical protein CLCR_01857 [Cladophialophora carrionii]|uniref:Uncharacterized protein n=1 Tax=Cladophialophora carrionii TaxID=86049 RepID=A0A1C1CDT0_9EURO|nr:hypothetical protein CLCR_01857 [Cladophialophora carrionii]
MEWTSSLKRTRNGSIYSDTTSTLRQLNGHANKRRRAMMETETRIAASCHLENLPDELLQQVFLTAMNGNLLTASPRIAVKLSGTKAVYRAAFLLAFYSHDVDKMFSAYNLHYLVPILDLPLSSWDVRSMTRAVLNSSWCTWGQVRMWLADNLAYAITKFQAVSKQRSLPLWFSRFTGGPNDLGTLLARCLSGVDEENRSLALEMCMWDIRLTRDSDIYEDEESKDAVTQQNYDLNAYTADWDTELIFHCQMRVFGVLTIGDEKAQNYNLHHTDAFRNVVTQIMGFGTEDLQQRPSMDSWPLLDERALRATRNAQWLRETLAIDYFLYPEDQPFKVSPRLYRAAALADIKLEEGIHTEGCVHVPVLYVLFQVDPRGLPREDPALVGWAARARRRILDFFDNLGTLQYELVERRNNHGGTLNNSDRHRYCALELEYKFRYEMDWKIASYIETGSLGEALPDPLAPDFKQPLGWLGERLNPSPKALDEARKLSYPNLRGKDVDIFHGDLDDDLDYPFASEQEVVEEALYVHFGRVETEIEWEASFVLDRISRAEAYYALTTEDEYYQSEHQTDYQVLFDRREFWTMAEPDSDGEENTVSDSWDNEDENEERNDTEEWLGWSMNTLRHGLLDETPIEVNCELSGLDVAVTFPDDFRPIPSKDTELIEPFLGPPQWFHPAKKPYFEEINQGHGARKLQSTI